MKELIEWAKNPKQVRVLPADTVCWYLIRVREERGIPIPREVLWDTQEHCVSMAERLNAKNAPGVYWYAVAGDRYQRSTGYDPKFEGGDNYDE